MIENRAMKDEEKIEEMTGVMNEAKSVADEAEKKYEEVMAGDAAGIDFFSDQDIVFPFAVAAVIVFDHIFAHCC